MDAERCQFIITAEPGEAFTEICGVSVLERLLRQLQRIGARQVTIFAQHAESIIAHLARPSWARAGITAVVQQLDTAAMSAQNIAAGAPALVLSCAYYDSLLLSGLLAQEHTSVLVDSQPPAELQPLIVETPRLRTGVWCGAVFVDADWLSKADATPPLFELLREAAEQGAVQTIDAHTVPNYRASMRRHIRPLWFPSPQPTNIARAERLVLDAAQNGTLDLPAIVHGPIETWIVGRLCKTSITPNQISLSTAAISTLVVVLFAAGQLAAGTVLALAVGILDGLDGKQARVKVETTPLGQGEHMLDYVLELSWWTALAWHFGRSGILGTACALLILLVGGDLIDRAAKARVKAITGRNLDDVAPMDRFVRLIGGRRNIYIWMFAAGLLLRAADKAFVALCWWGAVTAAVHVGRAMWISGQSRVSRTEGAAH